MGAAQPLASHNLPQMQITLLRPTSEGEAMTEPAVLELAREAKSSIELHLSAKGEHYWTIKRYYDEADPEAQVAALRALTEIDQVLQGIFHAAS